MPLDSPIDATPDTVRAVLAPIRNDFAIAVVTPGNAFAVGAIIRVAHSFLAREIIVVGADDWYPKASMGMHKYEKLVRVESAEGLFDYVQERPLWAIEKDHARATVQSVDRFPPGVVFVFGSERYGLPRTIVERADEVVGIPIYGINQSLPVAVAAGIVMHEWARRRYAAGTVV